MGAGEDAALTAIAASLDAIFDEAAAGATRMLLEVTAGQGTVVGHRLEHLEAIVAASRHPERLAICLDTCHLLAAGYPVDTPEGIDEVLDEVVSRFGAERLACVHVNDSKHPRGSRKDRHANIGEGHIATRGVRAIAAPSAAGTCADGDRDADGRRRAGARARSGATARARPA